jgi:hypothetical protein
MHNIIRKRLHIKIYNKALLYSEKKQLIFRKIYIYYCIPCIYFFWSTGEPGPGKLGYQESLLQNKRLPPKEKPFV